MRALVAFCLLAVALPMAPAAASCAMPEGDVAQQLAEADAVFVGTVVRTPGDDRIAHVAVEQIWRGEVDHGVTVRGSSMAGQRDAGTSVDRRYRAGTRYLFAVRGRGATFDDDACSPTRQWQPALAAHRPVTPASWCRPRHRRRPALPPGLSAPHWCSSARRRSSGCHGSADSAGRALPGRQGHRGGDRGCAKRTSMTSPRG
jgi:hypothetical protein